MQTHSRNDLKQICELLAPGRRWVYRSELSAAISRALVKTFTGLVFVTLLSLGFAVARWAGAGISSRIADWVLSLGGIVAAVLLIGGVIFGICTSQPSLAETAERLDLSLGSLNQIATTYDLANKGVSTCFAHEQIKVGIGLLRASCNSKPMLSTVDWKWRANTTRLLVVLMGIGAIELLPARFGSGTSRHSRNLLVTAQTEIVTQAEAQKRLQSQSNSQVPSDDDSSSMSFASVSGGSAETPGSSLLNSQSAVNIATAGSAGSASSKSDDAHISNSMQSKLSSKGSRLSSSKHVMGDRSAGSAATGEPADSDQETANSNVQTANPADALSGANGTASDAQPAATPSDSGNQKAETESNSTPQTNEPDNTSNGSKSRREGQSVPSNQASSAGQGDQPGHGRGDGNAQSKKSRGVGSVMLGTPVPDLVMGKLSTGTSAMSRRQIPPDPSNSESIRPADTRVHGSTVESQITRFDLLPSDAGDLASQYLIQLHASDSAAEAVPPSQPSGAISP